MATMSGITVYDGADTPVQHLLQAVSVTRAAGKVEAHWRESVEGVPIDAQISCTMTLQKMGSGVYKTESRVEVPVMESISGQNAAGYTAAPKVAFVDTVITTGFFHPRSTAESRRLARQIAVNIDGNITTSVAPSTTGPLPILFDLLIAPT